MVARTVPAHSGSYNSGHPHLHKLSQKCCMGYRIAGTPKTLVLPLAALRGRVHSMLWACLPSEAFIQPRKNTL